ncbi:MAG TPA: hypothetical protein GXX18_11645 [Bacillales bacterium]|nr:hypothetical protein [Bacillales bacterium]
MNVKTKKIVGSILAILLLFILSFVAQPSFADDDDDHHKYREGESYNGHYDKHDENEVLKEGGEVLGWGTVIAIAGAGALMPLRRGSRRLIKKFPNAKSGIISALKILGKSHIWIGALAIILSTIHGIIMYINEREFEFDEISGMISVGLMAIAAIFGVLLMKNKGSKQYRSLHFGFMIVAVIIGAAHVLIS